MKELGITKGEWEAKDYYGDVMIFAGDDVIADMGAEGKAEDAILICDAGNTTQKCGLLPSELLQQRDELKEALTELSGLFEYLHGGAIVGKSIRQRAIAAIKNTEQ